VTRSSKYIHNFLVNLVDEAQAHSHKDNVAMAKEIIDIGLSGRTHQEQNKNLQQWINNYAWAAADNTASVEGTKQEMDADAKNFDDDVKADS
jgi:hypothetical protein